MPLGARTEEARTTLDFLYEKSWGDTYVLKGAIKNITDDKVEFSRNGQIVESYSEGVEFSVGLNVSL